MITVTPKGTLCPSLLEHYYSVKPMYCLDSQLHKLQKPAIAQSSDPTVLDISALLCNAINDLSTAALSKAEVTSKEAGYRAMASLVELWMKLNPLTLDEVIDALERTGATPADVVKRIKERLSRM